MPEKGLPLQWIIPKLYISARIRHIIDWDKPFKKHHPKYLQKFNNILIEKAPNFTFIGRRYEQRLILNALKRKKPVIITGQGGLGKTTLAEHIINRLNITQDIKEVFAYTYYNMSPERILDDLNKFLNKHKHQELKNISQIIEKAATQEKDILSFKLNAYLNLLKQIDGKFYFLFDNLETFQDLKNHNITNKDLEKTIDIITEHFPVIITSRYPVPNKNWEEVNLNSIGYNDFYLKIIQTNIYPIITFLKTKLDTNKILGLIYEKFGGNYRMIEMLDAIITKDFNTQKILKISNEQDFINNLLKTDLAIGQIKEDLLFDRLYELLTPDEKKVLQILAEFFAPVTPQAIAMQISLNEENIEQILNYLRQASLCERITSEKNQYQINFLIKTLLKEKENLVDFSHQKAGQYFEDNNLTIAFEHYLRTKNFDKIANLGLRLTNSFYSNQIFSKAIYYGEKTYAKLKESSNSKFKKDISAKLLNTIGLSFIKIGDYDTALKYFKQALEIRREIGDRQGEGATLNNIALIYHARGDYDTALKYLKQALEIRREIGDRQGEGTTLNNISQIYKARGDYDTALKYLKQALEITREIGDRQGEGTTLNNISQIYDARGDYDTALKYLKQALEILREIGDRQREGATLNNISQIYKARGDYETALKYLKQALEITREIGNRQGEGTTLNNIASIYKARGDYDTALKYFKQALEILREIGDLNRLAITMFNMGTLYLQQGKIQDSIEYLLQTYLINQQIKSYELEEALKNMLKQFLPPELLNQLLNNGN